MRDFVADRRALAATEFAVIVPLMLVMFFGTVEFSSAIAIDRKVTLIARTLSDLTSQSTTLADTDMQNAFTASISAIMPYDATFVKGTISEIYIDANSIATIQWSKTGTITSGAMQATLATSARKAGDKGHHDDSVGALDSVELPHTQRGELHVHAFGGLRVEVEHTAERSLLHAAAPGHLCSLQRRTVVVLKSASGYWNQKRPCIAHGLFLGSFA
ncbi:MULTISPECIES: TadE/TadG family type IV pilus assembly protein [unclassified Bradyrhizobium]|uniref:TadE/TadG family type IV pilus assembly protein n=1 Tax=unclassified Bradyrhizobium TaxID=2631580 RepID=UPI00247A83E6|nr:MULTISPECIES: TadE/TadG family type IV pilus assembly protein [unclassified Bradyrhizobium]WGR70866.1 pilus assembly protein [Bradyrhizobium sp. ISRA426]WGR75705.1 pilus assembly protein [Bradyrhizobium sp. ISRA430]WGR86108.1 pilus assembly protein [Bradyrhizobium sp. ISRA432]